MRPEKICEFAPKTPYSGGVQRQEQRAYYNPWEQFISSQDIYYQNVQRIAMSITFRSIATLAAGTLIAGAALAAPPAPLLPSSGDCSPSYSQSGQSPTFADLTGVTVNQCAGFFEGNDINSGNAASLALINSVITSASWGSLAALTGTPNNWLAKYDTSNTLINFGRTLYGDTIVGFHWGNVDGAAGNVSALYRFDAGTTGISSFTVLGGGLSNAALYMTAAPVPEPETYALMLAGLGVVGFMARRRKAT